MKFQLLCQQTPDQQCFLDLLYARPAEEQADQFGSIFLLRTNPIYDYVETLVRILSTPNPHPVSRNLTDLKHALIFCQTSLTSSTIAKSTFGQILLNILDNHAKFLTEQQFLLSTIQPECFVALHLSVLAIISHHALAVTNLADKTALFRIIMGRLEAISHWIKTNRNGGENFIIELEQMSFEINLAECEKFLSYLREQCEPSPNLPTRLLVENVIEERGERFFNSSPFEQRSITPPTVVDGDATEDISSMLGELSDDEAADEENVDTLDSSDDKGLSDEDEVGSPAPSSSFSPLPSSPAMTFFPPAQSEELDKKGQLRKYLLLFDLQILQIEIKKLKFSGQYLGLEDFPEIRLDEILQNSAAIPLGELVIFTRYIQTINYDIFNNMWSEPVNKIIIEKKNSVLSQLYFKTMNKLITDLETNSIKIILASLPEEDERKYFINAINEWFSPKPYESDKLFDTINHLNTLLENLFERFYSLEDQRDENIIEDFKITWLPFPEPVALNVASEQPPSPR